MTEEAKKARREYLNKWRKNNPEKVKAQKERYWEKKAAQQAADATEVAKEVQPNAGVSDDRQSL